MGLEENKIDEEVFINQIKKVNKKRHHKVNNSIGVYDSYKYIRKNKWFNKIRPLTEHEFYSIIRGVNNILAEELSNGNDVTLPNKMGRLELRKYNANVSFVEGKLKTNLPIDWNRTLKLWYEDSPSRKNKTLIRIEEKELYKVYYNRGKAEYNNKTFYQFNVNREIKKNLKTNIKEGNIDAFLF